MGDIYDLYFELSDEDRLEKGDILISLENTNKITFIAQGIEVNGWAGLFVKERKHWGKAFRLKDKRFSSFSEEFL